MTQPLPDNPAPAQICAPARDVDDRLGEALRRYRHGLVRPLWADMPDDQKDGWRNVAAGWRITILRDVGLRVEIE